MASSKEAEAQNAEEQKKQEQTAPATPPVKLEGDELKEAIKKQVEYYFSKENLCQDAFLVGKMDAQHYVEVAIIADFKMVKQLTTDQTLILESVKDSSCVVVDVANKKIKPVAVNARTTLILRNIPSGADKAAVEKLLDNEKCPKVLELKPEIGDNWFASFATEEETKDALTFAKELSWEGKKIGCAIKSENLLKGLTPGSPPKGFFVPNYAQSGAYGYGGYMGPDGQQYRNARQGQRRGGPGGPGVVMGNGVPTGADDNNGRRKGKAKARTGGRDGHGLAHGVNPAKETPQAPINLADFPKLEGAGKRDSGYNSKPFKAYNRDEMIKIIRSSEPGPVEVTTQADVPFLAERDMKLEGEKTPEEVMASQSKHDNKSAPNDTPAAPAAPTKEVENNKSADKAVEKAPEKAGKGAEKSGGGGSSSSNSNKEGDKGGANGKGEGDISSANGAPKKLSYAQMAYANGAPKKEAE